MNVGKYSPTSHVIQENSGRELLNIYSNDGKYISRQDAAPAKSGEITAIK